MANWKPGPPPDSTKAEAKGAGSGMELSQDLGWPNTCRCHHLGLSHSTFVGNARLGMACRQPRTTLHWPLFLEPGHCAMFRHCGPGAPVDHFSAANINPPLVFWPSAKAWQWGPPHHNGNSLAELTKQRLVQLWRGSAPSFPRSVHPISAQAPPRMKNKPTGARQQIRVIP